MKSDQRMFWADRIAQQVIFHVEKEEILKKIVSERGWICYDEKTPSGRIHIGSGRGWVIHDTIARALRSKGLDAKFILSSDDMDPMDKLPNTKKSKNQKKFMGIPFRNIPSPEPNYNSYAEYYFNDVTQKFEEFGIEAIIESTGDHYLNGDFNETIKIALDNANRINEIYSRFYETTVASNKLPFNPICQNCGKIGTTRAYEWNHKTELLKYKCEPNLVSWANGCSFDDEISPYNGNGKFPWKVEWAAKWKAIGVAYETAGKDHFSAGGSRDIAIAISVEIFNHPPPYPSTYKKTESGYKYNRGAAYEFFQVGGAKMSTSKGQGFPFAEMTQYAPGNILKFLLVRTRPKSVIDFDPQKDLERIYRDYDDTEKKYFQTLLNPEMLEKDKYFNAKRLYELSHVGKISSNQPAVVEFNFGIMVVQLTKNTSEAIELLQQKGALPPTLTNNELIETNRRLNFFRDWIRDLAPPEKIITLSKNQKINLSKEEKQIINKTILIIKTSADEHELAPNIKRLTEQNQISLRQYYELLYTVLIGKKSGPRLVPFIIYSGKETIIQHLQQYI